MRLRGIARRTVDVCVGVIIGLLLGLDVIFARSIDMSKAGVTLWIFLAVGAFIILLQMVPAFILFTTLIAGVHKSVDVEDKVHCCSKEEAKE